MVNVFHLYIDDSGTRDCDRNPGKKPAHNYDWFALGGIIIHERDEPHFREAHEKFCQKWNISYPLRSADIRAKARKFHWLNKLSDEQAEEFYEDLYRLISESNVLGIACVIDRPGYNARYKERYGTRRWLLCKTAFSVVVERAAKYSFRHNGKLRVFPERGDIEVDKTTLKYYRALKTEGMPFTAATSGKYAPLSSDDFDKILYDFKTKNKTSPLAQLADLYLWPICMGGYNKNNRPYSRLMNDKKIIDSVLTDGEKAYLGVKYSCFELVHARPK